MKALLRNPGPLVGVLAFALVSVLLTAMVGGTLSRAAGPDTVRIRAEFRDAAGLRVGDDVRIAGVRVGRVSDTELRGGLASVTLDVDATQRLDSATTASINFLNLMGQRYVALAGRHAPDARPLGEGDVIPLSRTRPALDLTALFNAFQPLFENLRPGDINELAGNLVQVLQGEGPTLRDLTRQTALLTRTIADRDQVIGEVVDNVTLVLRTANSHREQIKALIGDLGDLTHGLARDRAALGASMDSISDLSTLAAGLLDEVGPPITRDVRKLQAFSHFLAGNTGALARAVTGIPTQLAIYIRTLGYGSFLNVYICNLFIKPADGPAVDFNPGDTHSRRCR